MVSMESRRQLLGKVAVALSERAGHTHDTDVAKRDLERLQRLVDLGEIPYRTYEGALKSVLANDQLSDEVRAWAASEARKLEGAPHKVLDSTTFVSAGGTYRGDQVSVPATADLERLDGAIWHRLSGEGLQDLVRNINPVDGKLRVSVQTTQFYWCRLPWYDNVVLLRIRDPGWSRKDLALHYLVMEQALFRLNGTSPAIHEVNAKAPLRLSGENVADYLRFFCLFVHGQEGPFYVLERPDDPLLPGRESLQPYEKHIKAVSHDGIDDKGRFLLSGLVMYSNALFITNFAVQPTGMIEMLDDEPVASDLPFRISFALS